MADNALKYAIALLFPLIIAVIWGLFAVPNDPSRSGRAPVPIPGIIRLFLEIGIFGLACWILLDLGYIKLAYALLISVFIHYIISYDRIKWLINH